MWTLKKPSSLKLHNKPNNAYMSELKSPDYSEEDEFFALCCMFEDLNRLRSYLEKVWTKYRDNRLDLVTASVTTNTAIQHAIRTQEEIFPIYPGVVDYRQMYITYVTDFAIATKQMNPSQAALSTDEMEWIFFPANNLLASFCKALHPGSVPVMKKGYFGVYNPRDDRSRLTIKQQEEEDLIILMEILPEFCFLAKEKIPMVVKDEITRGLCELALTKDIPVWLVFAVTIFLDIHQILREKVESGFGELQLTAKEWTKTLTRYFELSEGLGKPASWPSSNEVAFHAAQTQIDAFVLQDPIYLVRDQYTRSWRTPQPMEIDRFYLCRRHPVLCGLTPFTILLHKQYLGLTLVNAMGTGIFPAHFYNALRQKQTPVAPWPIMETMIKFHGEDRVFLGAKPTKIIDCYK